MVLTAQLFGIMLDLVVPVVERHVVLVLDREIGLPVVLLPMMFQVKAIMEELEIALVAAAEAVLVKLALRILQFQVLVEKQERVVMVSP